MRTDNLTPQQMTILAYQAILPGKYDYAERMFLKALDDLRGLASSDIHYTLSLTGLGQVYLQQDRFEEAEMFFQQALAHYEKYFGDDAFGRFSTLCHLGSVNLQQGSLEKSRSLYERALTLGEETLMNQQIVLAHACLEGYAEVLERLKLLSEAEDVKSRIRLILGER